MSGVTQAVRADAKTARADRLGGREVRDAWADQKGAHVFDDSVDLDALEHAVWTRGQYAGRVPGGDHRSDFDRSVWESPTPVGRRVQPGRPDQPLYWVEIKGKLNKAGEWRYHLVPRGSPAT